MYGIIPPMYNPTNISTSLLILIVIQMYRYVDMHAKNTLDGYTAKTTW